MARAAEALEREMGAAGYLLAATRTSMTRQHFRMVATHAAVLRRLQGVPVADVSMSVVTKSELLYGVEVSPRRAQDAAALAAFLPYVEVLGFPDDAAPHYAEIRAGLKKRGSPIGANDLFVAAHARSLGLTLVTDNTAKFRRVTGLRVENWTQPPRRIR